MTDNRAKGLKLAQKLGAVETMKAIKDRSLSYKEIYNIAVKEIGIEKFTSVILESDPSWSEQALRYVYDLGAQKNAIAERAREMYMDRIIVEDESNGLAAAIAIPEASAVRLRLVDPIGFECSFALTWRTWNLFPSPKASNVDRPDPENLNWSKKLSIFDREAELTHKERMTTHKPHVWPLVSVVCGQWYDLEQFGCTISEGAGIITVEVSGAVDNPQFKWATSSV